MSEQEAPNPLEPTRHDVAFEWARNAASRAANAMSEHAREETEGSTDGS